MRNAIEECKDIELGKAEIIRQGKDISIIAIGKMVDKAFEIAEKLKDKNIEAEIINARFLKPIDSQTILKSMEKTKKVITIEDGTLKGGLATSVIECLNNSDLENIKVKSFGYNDCFVEHGKVEELEEKYGLTLHNLIESIMDIT